MLDEQYAGAYQTFDALNVNVVVAQKKSQNKPSPFQTNKQTDKF